MNIKIRIISSGHAGVALDALVVFGVMGVMANLDVEFTQNTLRSSKLDMGKGGLAEI